METTGYWTLKVEALDRILLSTGFVRGYGLIARQAMERMKSLSPDACCPHNCCHILQLPRIYSAYPGQIIVLIIAALLATPSGPSTYKGDFKEAGLS
jgi:hypothetical protein